MLNKRKIKNNKRRLKNFSLVCIFSFIYLNVMQICKSQQDIHEYRYLSGGSYFFDKNFNDLRLHDFNENGKYSLYSVNGTTSSATLSNVCLSLL